MIGKRTDAYGSIIADFLSEHHRSSRQRIERCANDDLVRSSSFTYDGTHTDTYAWFAHRWR